MANLSVRQLDDETILRLRIRAAEHGVSMEEEARRILRQSVATPENIGDLALQLFGSQHVIDLQLAPREPHLPEELSS